MSRLLHLDASARDDGSATRRLSRLAVERWTSANPDGRVAYRDLAGQPVGAIDAAWVRAAFRPPERRSAADVLALAESDALVDEFLAHDVIVAGVPMYNFSVPAAFKAWVDLVVRLERTFTYGPDGPRGLAGDKHVLVVVSATGDYTGPLKALDHHEPWLRDIFGFMGVRDVTYLRVRDGEGSASEQEQTLQAFCGGAMAGTGPP